MTLRWSLEAKLVLSDIFSKRFCFCGTTMFLQRVKTFCYFLAPK